MSNLEKELKVKKCIHCANRDDYCVKPADEDIILMSWDQCSITDKCIRFLNLWRPWCKNYRPNMEFRDGFNNKS